MGNYDLPQLMEMISVHFAEVLRLQSLFSLHGKYLDVYNEKIKILLPILFHYLTVCSDSIGILIMFIIDSEKREQSVIGVIQVLLSEHLCDLLGLLELTKTAKNDFGENIFASVAPGVGV